MKIGKGYEDRFLEEGEVRDILSEGLVRVGLGGKRVLVVIPDSTRTAPIPLMFRLFNELLVSKVAQLDFLVALGTHPLMSEEALGSQGTPGDATGLPDPAVRATPGLPGRSPPVGRSRTRPGKQQERPAAPGMLSVRGAADRFRTFSSARQFSLSPQGQYRRTLAHLRTVSIQASTHFCRFCSMRSTDIIAGSWAASAWASKTSGSSTVSLTG
jgi:hypothetical protein